MNVIILGGFLGSGKTTVLLSLAKYIVNQYKSEDCNTPVAIIENEIGDVSVDDKFLSAGGYKIKTLFSGCVCCTLSSDLTLNINHIAENINPTYVIVEATGLAYPDKIADTIRTYAKKCESVKIFVLADAERWDENMEYLDIMITNQMKLADVIILNKVDSVDDKTKNRIETELLDINNKARMISLSAINGIADEIWGNLLGGKTNV